MPIYLWREKHKRLLKTIEDLSTQISQEDMLRVVEQPRGFKELDVLYSVCDDLVENSPTTSDKLDKSIINILNKQKKLREKIVEDYDNNELNKPEPPGPITKPSDELVRLKTEAERKKHEEVKRLAQLIADAENAKIEEDKKESKIIADAQKRNATISTNTAKPKPITPVIDGFDAEKVINDDIRCTQKKREKAKVFSELKKRNLCGDNSHVFTLDNLKYLYERYQKARGKIAELRNKSGLKSAQYEELKKERHSILANEDAAFLKDKILQRFDSLCKEEDSKYPPHKNGCTKEQYIEGYLKSEDAIISQVNEFSFFLESNRFKIAELIDNLKGYVKELNEICQKATKTDSDVERSQEEINKLKLIAKQKQDTYNQAYETLKKAGSAVDLLKSSYQTYIGLIEKVKNAISEYSIGQINKLNANKIESTDENSIKTIINEYDKISIKEGQWAYASFEYYTTEGLNKYIDEIDKPIKQVTDYNNNFNYNRVKFLIDKLNKYISCLEEYDKEIIEHERQKAIAMTEKDLIEEDKRKLEEEVTKLNALSKKLSILFWILFGVAPVSLVFTFLFGWLWDIYWGYILFETISCISCMGYIVILIICWRLNKKIKKCEAEILENKQKIQELSAN